MLSVELPDVGDSIEEGEIFAEIESASTVHELVLSPVTGTVMAVNSTLEDNPAVINEDPYSDGWLIEVRLKKTKRNSTLSWTWMSITISSSKTRPNSNDLRVIPILVIRRAAAH